MNYLRHSLLLGLLPVLLGGSVASATPIQFFNTGVAVGGSLLASGAADPNYTLIYSSDGGSYTAMASTPNPAWVPNSSTAGWIGPTANGNNGMNSGYYVYQATLDLTGYNAATASLSGMVAADDCLYIYLNQGGNAVFSESGFAALTPFLINSGFVNGVNLIDFVVVNAGGPTGLMVDDTLATATAQAPEPGSLLLMMTGLAGGAALLLRRHRSLAG